MPDDEDDEDDKGMGIVRRRRRRAAVQGAVRGQGVEKEATDNAAAAWGDILAAAAAEPAPEPEPQLRQSVEATPVSRRPMVVQPTSPPRTPSLEGPGVSGSRTLDAGVAAGPVPATPVPATAGLPKMRLLFAALLFLCASILAAVPVIQELGAGAGQTASLGEIIGRNLLWIGIAFGGAVLSTAALWVVPAMRGRGRGRAKA